MERRIEDVEKSMKRSNDKQLKIEHELCQRVSGFTALDNILGLNFWLLFLPFFSFKEVIDM